MSVCGLTDTYANIFAVFEKTERGAEIVNKDGLGIKRTRFCEIIVECMPWVIPLAKIPRWTCLCWICEQLRLYSSALKAAMPEGVEGNALGHGSDVKLLEFLMPCGPLNADTSDAEVEQRYACAQ